MILKGKAYWRLLSAGVFTVVGILVTPFLMKKHSDELLKYASGGAGKTEEPEPETEKEEAAGQEDSAEVRAEAEKAETATEEPQAAEA